MDNQQLTIITLNEQGLHNSCNCKTLLSWLNCAKPDIIALQETHCISEAEFESWLATETLDQNYLQCYLVVSSQALSAARRCTVT
jgi:exonuclease III